MEPHPLDEPLEPVDYDRVQHHAYAKGRALPASAIRRYMAAFAEHLPARRPLNGVDLGSGTGRFTPALAETFGGPIQGVEPASAMRRTAISESAHPAVAYLEGRAEAIPVADGAADFVLMFLSYHHVGDKPAAAREIARVLKPGGRLILRSTFRERIPDHWWRGYFPRTWDVERAMFPTEAETRALVERLKLRAVSTFEHLTEDELAEGFANIEADLAAGAIVRKSATSDFVVFERRHLSPEPAIT